MQDKVKEHIKDGKKEVKDYVKEKHGYSGKRHLLWGDHVKQYNDGHDKDGYSDKGKGGYVDKGKGGCNDFHLVDTRDSSIGKGLHRGPIIAQRLPTYSIQEIKAP